MRLRVDPQSDAIYLNLTQKKIESSEEVADDIILDYDATGGLVGIEILEASKKFKDKEIMYTMTMEYSQVA